MVPSVVSPGRESLLSVTTQSIAAAFAVNSPKMIRARMTVVADADSAVEVHADMAPLLLRRLYARWIPMRPGRQRRDRSLA